MRGGKMHMMEWLRCLSCNLAVHSTVHSTADRPSPVRRPTRPRLPVPPSGKICKDHVIRMEGSGCHGDEQ